MQTASNADCSPPADKSAPSAVVVTPAGSMAGGCALSALRYLAFVGPLPKFEVNRYFGTGVCHTRELRDDFLFDYVESLDAPEFLPMGGFDSMEFGRSSGRYFVVVAFGDVARD